MKSFLKKSFVSPAVLSILLVAITACDFHGPWEYYPDEREVYTGIYTYGHVSDFIYPEVCFSKVYQLDEASAENFNFYDSAYVTLQGKFKVGANEYDTTIVLTPSEGKANCLKGYAYGIQGESYKMDAYFVWDSAGSTAKSRYSAVAAIPKPIKVTGLNVPKQDGSYEFREYTEGKVIGVDFLEFPMDMEFVKCALDFDKSIGGVLSILNYDASTVESQNTTINEMLKGLTEADSAGYRGIAMHDPFERRQNLGYTENRWIGGFNNLDTLYLMNMMMPIGNISVDFYTTDHAYVDYERKVKESVSDSRVVPESNVENGMGVFFGMSKTSLELNVRGEGVDMDHIAINECDYTGNGDDESWETRACRLYQDIACAGVSLTDISSDLMKENVHAYEYYRDTSYTNLNKDYKTCFPSRVKMAMILDTTKWSIFLPDTIHAEDKSEAYADGLKRYCIASNFKSNHIADCSELEELCLKNTEKNYCKEYLWEWCADRNWDFFNYEQCNSAFVSRYYLEELKSSILKREVEEICNYAAPRIGEGSEIQAEFATPICENWCKFRDGKTPLRVVCE